MDRRTFLYSVSLGAFVGLTGRALHAEDHGLDVLRIRVEQPAIPLTPLGMPGLFPGRVIETHHAGVIERGRVSQPAVKRMLASGMTTLTGDASPEAAWRRFIEPTDVVGIKVNPSGSPFIVSRTEIVREVIASLRAIGVPAANIIVYDRNSNQLDLNGYNVLMPAGVRVVGLDDQWVVDGERHGGYDRDVFCEMNCFGERETRSYLGRIISTEVDKIINIPVVKEHNASGVTGCLKNLAYGSYNNVARTHVAPTTYTSPAIAVMCASLPVRTKAVLHVMDGIRGGYHAGPFSWNPSFHFEPRSILIGTDPVALDRIELEMVERKRRDEGVPSLWDHDPAILGSVAEMQTDARKNRFHRQPAHIRVSGELGLGRWDLAQIDHRRVEVA